MGNVAIKKQLNKEIDEQYPYEHLLSQFLDMELDGGRPERQIANIRTFVRTFLRYSPHKCLTQITADDFIYVRDSICKEIKTKDYITNVLKWMGLFLGYVNGYNPQLEIDPKAGNLRWFDRKMGDFVFTVELEQFIDDCRQRGLSKVSIRKKKERITCCLRVLHKQMCLNDLNMLDLGAYTYLVSLMSNVRDDVTLTIIGDLDEFLTFNTGRRILPEWKKNRHNIQIPKTEEYIAMEEVVSAYSQDCEERGLRPITIRGLRSSIWNCYYRMTELFGPIHPKDITYKHIRNVRTQTTDITERTLKFNLCRMGQCLEFYYGVNPYRRANLRWNPPNPKRTWIFKSEWRELISVATLKEKVVLVLAGAMGLRRREIVTLKLSDIRGDKMRILGKGAVNGKVVIKDIPSSVRKVIDEYIEVRTQIVEETGYIDQDNFLVRDDMLRGAPITDRFVEYALETLTKKTGIYVTCHTLRRFYCTSLSDAGVDLNTIRIMMRHESLSTTLDSYLSIDPRKMVAATNVIDDFLF